MKREASLRPRLHELSTFRAQTLLATAMSSTLRLNSGRLAASEKDALLCYRHQDVLEVVKACLFGFRSLLKPLLSLPACAKMEDMHKRSSFSAGDSILELEDLLERIFVFIEDCSAISLVCKKWYNVDRRTRRKVTVTSCYAINPARLTGRFQALQAVKIRGKPRAAMFRLVPDEWGGARGSSLQVLKLVKCSGFSTTGLEAITTHCRALRVLSVEECSLEDHSGRWLHELSQHNSSLESLNIAGTDLQNVTMGDLATLTSNCKSLTSLKLNDLELENLADILKRTTALQELGGVSISDERPRIKIALPSRLTSLVSLYYMGANEGDEVVNSLIQPIAASLRKIDLQFAFLSVPGHCELLGHCSNLEALEVFNAIGDEGLEVIASKCKNLRWLRVERGDRDVQQGFVTQRGLISVAMNCHLLEYIAVYVTDINNAALKTVAENCPNLKDFRLVLLDEDNVVSDYPLDDGGRVTKGSRSLRTSTGTGRDLLPLTLDNWNVELIDEPGAPTQFVAYRCLSGKRTDAPAMVTVLG
ncbi:hypothetical protein GOP47_0005038 [Adiantum capillus-veneris]|uniref:F-box domain-containing protein n=1 Tax=Adiantum capillus-veneris TaxID=13818 RepID=A0A9D4V4E4_ADICA|nr:hypothetical protein GOP47_0005038 [Adiantum capillus-veneris]